MKCQILFSEKTNEKYFNMSSAVNQAMNQLKKKTLTPFGMAEKLKMSG